LPCAWHDCRATGSPLGSSSDEPATC